MWTRLLLVCLLFACNIAESGAQKTGVNIETFKSKNFTYIVQEVLRIAKSKISDSYRLMNFNEGVDMYNGISEGWKNFQRNGTVVTIPELSGSTLILTLIKFRKITATYMVGVTRGLVGHLLGSASKEYAANDLQATIENMSVIMMLEIRPKGFYPPIDLVGLRPPRIKSLTVSIKRGSLKTVSEWLDAIISPLIEAAVHENIQDTIKNAIQEATEEIVHLVKK